MTNTVEEISEENAVDAFTRGLRRRELKEELGHRKPKTVAQLMDIANEWANGKDYMRSDRSSGPEDREYLLDSGCNRRYDNRKKRK